MKKQGFAPQSKKFFFLSQSFKAVLVIHLFNFDADPGFVAKLKSGSSTVYTNMNPDPVQCTRIWIRIQYSVHKYESGPSPVYTNMNPDPVQWTRIWIRTQSSVHEYESGSSTVYTNMKFDNFSYQKKVQNVETWINIQWGFNGISWHKNSLLWEKYVLFFIFRYLLCHLESRSAELHSFTNPGILSIINTIDPDIVCLPFQSPD